MVAKINKGNNLFGTLIYNNRKVENDLAKIIHSNKVIQDKNGEYNMLLCNQSFAPFLVANRKTEEPILHISLNPHPDDVLTDEQLIDIADEYMREMGFGEQPYIVFKHEDIERKHIHIVSVNVDETGRKINDFNNFHRSKKITEELEAKYKLHPAGKLDYSEEVPRLKKVDYKSGNVKKQLTGNVKALMQSYRFTSLPEYRALLSLYNIGVEEVSGEARDKPYRGLVYSALDSKGNKVGNPIKSSSIARSVGYAALIKKAASSEKLIKENGLTGRVKTMLDTAIKNYRSKTSFEAELLRNGISVVFRETTFDGTKSSQNAEGRIYGATFIDHENRAVLNGSKIGKAYAANEFHNLFQNSREDEPLHTNQEIENMEERPTPHPTLELDVTAPTNEQEDKEIPTIDFSENTNEQKYDDTAFGSLPSLLEQHGADYEAKAIGQMYNNANGGWSSIVPTQNLVDMYEMKDGLTKEESATYDATHPFKDRDPRMAMSILFPGVGFEGEIFNTLDEYLPDGSKNDNFPLVADNASKTALTWAKYLAPMNQYPDIWDTGACPIIFRYAEVLLTYAEAKNELSGPSTDIYNALNSVRNRAGMPDVDQTKYATKEKLRELIRRERSVELAGEGLRRADIVRWKDSNNKMIAETVLNGPLYRIVGTVSYTETDPFLRATVNINAPAESRLVENRVFKAHNRYLPIPQSSIDKNPTLKQNTGY